MFICRWLAMPWKIISYLFKFLFIAKQNKNFKSFTANNKSFIPVLSLRLYKLQNSIHTKILLEFVKISQNLISLIRVNCETSRADRSSRVLPRYISSHAAT